MAQALERTLNIYLNVLPGSTLEYTEISNLVEEESLPYGQEYISFLARTEKIDAYKEGRNWLTTKEAVEANIKKRNVKDKSPYRMLFLFLQNGLNHIFILT